MRLPLIAVLLLSVPAFGAPHPTPVRMTFLQIWKDPDKWAGKWVTLTDCHMFVANAGGVFCGIRFPHDKRLGEESGMMMNQVMLDPMTSDFSGMPKPNAVSPLDIDNPKSVGMNTVANKACDDNNLEDNYDNGNCRAEVTGIFGMQPMPIPFDAGLQSLHYGSSAKMWHATIKPLPDKK